MMRTWFIAACMLVWGLGASCLMAESGYRTQYDYPDQGDDWYASVTAPDPRYDFLPTWFASYSNGDDFGLGYEIRGDLFGFGPPTDLTNTSLHEYYFRFGDYPVQPYTGGGGCTTYLDCLDGVLCDGIETCYHGRCIDGTPPSCSDFNSCTLDYCDIQTDLCAHDPITKPSEIRGLLLDRPDPATGVAALTWYVQPPSDDYNVYRGQFADLAGLACYQNEVVGTSLTDDGSIAASDLFIYLVTGYGCGGESTLGYDSDDLERINPTPCP